ncbi:MAG TPA: hypothetical protein PK079_14210 [Leptospiraceae bacterium]|nr:hypothetical protein [Leptospiraceae bacterium]HMW04171.1 hypothetical protein [Leptospiraceae bacterium]HMX34674.1 hypothetical protein [Leptospiraceae bacterium]HMY30164.1 hypothetical protein [Leptospiraceae bacterium]HMZ67638.1 hypothetical protein [Leptospiraceae bacterium]
MDYSNINEYPVAIEFFEEGGPVASKYKYLTHIRVFSKTNKIYLSYKEAREFISPKPRLVVSNEKELPLDVYKDFLNDLISHKVDELNKIFPNAKANGKANFFSFQLGNVFQIRFEYSNLDKETAEFKPYENILQIMRNLLFSNMR